MIRLTRFSLYSDKIDWSSVGDIIFSGNENNNVTLSIGVENYTYIEIFHTNNDGMYASVKVSNPFVGQKINLITTYTADDPELIIKSGIWKIASSTSISCVCMTEYSTKSSSLRSASYSYITKIVGYK